MWDANASTSDVNSSGCERSGKELVNHQGILTVRYVHIEASERKACTDMHHLPFHIRTPGFELRYHSPVARELFCGR